MCGFLFEFSFSELSDIKNFKKGLNSISHRGPDNINFLEFNNVRMGHTRLSIIDLNQRSNQPLTSNNLTIIYNGEIFNYKEIKKELESKGYKFNTKTDTEVIVNSFDHWGKDCVSKFNGMWSFVIYDNKTKEIFASRDRFGIKPFFVFKTPNGYIFSSEIEPLTKFGYKLKINKEYISEFIRQGDPEYNGATFFSEIQELFPAHNLIIKENRTIESYKYWDYPRKNKIKTNQSSFLAFEQLLTNSISLRLRSDVDIALLLSGGVDSTLIAEDIKKNNPGSLDRAYCYSSGDKYDESKYAKKIADRSGISLFSIKQTLIEDNYLERLSLLVKRFGKGLASRSVIPVSCIYEKIAEDGIKVAIDGQGADELLAGYKHYHLKVLPYYIKNLKVKFTYELLKDLIGNGVLKNIMLFYRSVMPEFMKNLGRIIIGYEKFLKIPQRQLSSKYNFLNCSKFNIKHEDPLNSYLMNQHINGLVYLIYYGDIISMMYSIENRSPFLDHRLIEFAYSTNVLFKVQGASNKFALRKNSLYKPVKNLLERKKVGFSTYISNEIKIEMISELRNSSIYELGIFSKKLKKDLLTNTFMKRKFEYILFRIYQVHLWLKIYSHAIEI